MVLRQLRFQKLENLAVPGLHVGRHTDRPLAAVVVVLHVAVDHPHQEADVFPILASPRHPYTHPGSLKEVAPQVPIEGLGHVPLGAEVGGGEDAAGQSGVFHPGKAHKGRGAAHRLGG